MFYSISIFDNIVITVPSNHEKDKVMNLIGDLSTSPYWPLIRFHFLQFILRRVIYLRVGTLNE